MAEGYEISQDYVEGLQEGIIMGLEMVANLGVVSREIIDLAIAAIPSVDALMAETEARLAND